MRERNYTLPTGEEGGFGAYFADALLWLPSFSFKMGSLKTFSSDMSKRLNGLLQLNTETQMKNDCNREIDELNSIEYNPSFNSVKLKKGLAC